MSFVCDGCGLSLASKQSLERHKKSSSCTEKKYQCNECKIKFGLRRNLNYHRKHHCKGKQSTNEEREKQIENLKIALAASHGLKTDIEQKKVIHNELNHCHIGDVNNIQVNITVLPIGQEKVDHLKNLSLDELRKKFGLKPEASTLVELFKSIRLDADHPENHNLLLTSKDSDKIHYYDTDGWKEGEFDERIRMALLDDKFRLRDFIGFRNWDDKFYWGYLEHHVGQKINEKDHVGLKPIYDGIRGPLLESTLKLAAQHDEASISLHHEEKQESQPSLTRVNSLVEERKLIEAKNREKELELELLKVKLSAGLI